MFRLSKSQNKKVPFFHDFCRSLLSFLPKADEAERREREKRGVEEGDRGKDQGEEGDEEVVVETEKKEQGFMEKVAELAVEVIEHLFPFLDLPQEECTRDPLVMSQAEAFILNSALVHSCLVILGNQSKVSLFFIFFF